MEKNFRYTTLLFPQRVENNKLFFNIVFLPRNRDPFLPMDTAIPGTTTTPFADMVPQFTVQIVKGLEDFPVDNAAVPPIAKQILVQTAARKKVLLDATKKSFGAQLNNTAGDKAEKVNDPTKPITVKKYLPESYRKSFNFTSPRHPNAVTDDSYHCAIRDSKPNSAPKTIDLLSWGKVFGYLLRQPILAKACGLIYSGSIDVEPEWFSKGGYIYVDLSNGDHVAVQNASWTVPDDGSFVKRYAARIPKLKPGENRSLFAPVLFPVLHSFGGAVTEPKAPWDEIFKEITAYDDGFAKIVHANQPISLNLLAEAQDGAHPVHDAGIRLGWDDEQLLIWYVRQMQENPNNPGKRVDAPIGLFGYRVDVKQNFDDAWQSLNTIITQQDYKIAFAGGAEAVGNETGMPLELPYQVYPSQVDSQGGKSFWLPMYFTNWIGRSLVMKDDVAAKLYKHGEANVAVNTDQTFAEQEVSFKLHYGKTYMFRVRMCDLSHGGPTVTDEVSALKQTINPSETVEFKRYIAPGKLRFTNLQNLLINTGNPKKIATEKNHVDFYNETTVMGEDIYDANPVVNLKRPLLGYPAVLFTNKYEEPDALAKLQATADADADPLNTTATRVGLGIADPDVSKVQIIVEVETLKLDNLLSYEGDENYAHLYTTHRNFNAEDFDAMLDVPFTFVDAPTLTLINFDRESSLKPFGNDELDIDNLNGRTDVIVPTARKVRITMRAVCEENEIYFGVNNGPKERQTRFGATTQIFLYKESSVEEILLQPWKTIPTLQGIYLQPDAPYIKQGVNDLFKRHGATDKPNIVQRLAKHIGIESKGLTLVSNPGQRVVFGCSSRIRHSLAPDLSSLTFASKEDLENHWICAIVYKLNRDWSWDALEDVAFTFTRTKRFLADTDNEELEIMNNLGDIEMKPMVSFEALKADRFGDINREETILIFLDAVEPKASLTKSALDKSLRFPDEIVLDYTMKARFKKGHGNNPLLPELPILNLPVTVRPSQIPKLASVGIAFSEYIVNGKYESTESRRRYLWIELSEPIQDPNDTLFCRMLAYAPDQLLSNNDFEMFAAPEEPPLPIDPEYVRSIIPNQTDDIAGLSAMQAMTKSKDSNGLYYLLPLPPGLHSESAELFGFFTYEFRVGHAHREERNVNPIWSTAQGRFGRALRVTGIQHPAPNLSCIVNRDEEKVYVNAPYGTAVYNGKNVTANPPRTQLWCLLYAQVMQADGLAYRNILLDDKYMDWKKKYFISPGLMQGFEKTYSNFIFKERNFKTEINTGINTVPIVGLPGAEFPITANPIITNPVATAPLISDSLKITEGAALAIFKDQQRTGVATWTNKEVEALLTQYGLPIDSSLSVLSVEVFGNITNMRQHFTKLFEPSQQKAAEVFTAKNSSSMFDGSMKESFIKAGKQQEEDFLKTSKIKPLSDGLGHYRILRSSPLTAVPFICCTE